MVRLNDDVSPVALFNPYTAYGNPGNLICIFRHSFLLVLDPGIGLLLRADRVSHLSRGALLEESTIKRPRIHPVPIGSVSREFPQNPWALYPGYFDEPQPVHKESRCTDTKS